MMESPKPTIFVPTQPDSGQPKRLRSVFGALGAAVVVSGILIGCGAPGGGSGKSGGAGAQTAEVAAPTGAKPTGKVEVVAFKGGFGIDFYEQAAAEFSKANPGVTVSVTGSPRIWEQLRPRLASGDAPDLMFPGWGLDHWKLADDGGLMTLDAALDSPSADGKTKWRDTFEPNILKLCQKDGHTYILPYYYNVLGWWYNPDVFAAHHWQVPQTYAQLLALCKDIKAAGMAPITFQGKYPYYMLEGMVYPWIQSVGGIQKVDDIQNLKPGAWKDPSVLAAAKMIAELKTDGYFEDGAVGMTHTESQSDFVHGKAAMIPCGTWLNSEMKSVMPAGTKLAFFLPPVQADGKGDPTALMISIEPWMVSTKAKNPNGAIAFFKYMTSLPEAQKFVSEKSSLMSIKGSDSVSLPESLVGASKAFKASKTVYSDEARQWYPSLETDIENNLTSLLNGSITPDQFCDQCEAAAEKARNDSSITKHTISGS